MTIILTYTLNESFNDENSNVHILNESFNDDNPNVHIKRIFQ